MEIMKSDFYQKPAKHEQKVDKKRNQLASGNQNKPKRQDLVKWGKSEMHVQTRSRAKETTDAMFWIPNRKTNTRSPPPGGKRTEKRNTNLTMD